MTLPPITNVFLPQRPDAPRPMFSSLAIASSGLTAQRVRMDVIAQNLANAETIKTPEGGPYHRRIVNLEAAEPQVALPAPVATMNITGPTGSAGSNLAIAMPSMNVGTLPGLADSNNLAGGVRVTSIGEDKSDGPMVYDPGNPAADKNGYIKLPNVNLTDEMIDLMNARRVYEANATVFQVARAMLHKAIDI